MIGVSVASGVVQQTLRSSLKSALQDNEDIDKIVAGVRQSLDYLRALDPPTRRIVRECYGHAISNGFGLMVGISIFAVLGAAFIREQKLGH